MVGRKINEHNRPANQPLNVEVGKREADAMFSRRDRAEAFRKRRAAAPREKTDFDRFLEELFPGCRVF